MNDTYRCDLCGAAGDWAWYQAHDCRRNWLERAADGVHRLIGAGRKVSGSEVTISIPPQL